MNRQSLPLVLLIVICMVSTGCKCYKYKEIKEPDENYITHSQDYAWQFNKHYIVHMDSIMYELAGVEIDHDKKTIYGKLIPFQGLPYLYYTQIVNKKNAIAWRRPTIKHSNAIKQLYIFVHNNSFGPPPSSATIKFKDITKFEITQNTTGLNIVTGAGLFYCILMSPWYIDYPYLR